MDQVDALTLKGCYDGLHVRLLYYATALLQFKELAGRKAAPNERQTGRQEVDALFKKLAERFADVSFRSVEEFVEEARQAAGWPRLHFKVIEAPTALRFARSWIGFVCGLWESDKRPFPQIVRGFANLLKDKHLPSGESLSRLLNNEYTLARRALKAMAMPPVEHDDPAPVEPSRKQKLKSRDKQIKLLCKTHKLTGKWVELATRANDDPIIQQLGLKPITKHIARNVMIPPQRRLKK